MENVIIYLVSDLFLWVARDQSEAKEFIGFSLNAEESRFLLSIHYCGESALVRSYVNNYNMPKNIKSLSFMAWFIFLTNLFEKIIK